MARYEIALHHDRQLPKDGTIVTVHANTRPDAENRALSIGWSGSHSRVQVTVLRVDDTEETTDA